MALSIKRSRTLDGIERTLQGICSILDTFIFTLNDLASYGENWLFSGWKTLESDQGGSKNGRIKKRAAHSENFLGRLVCTGNLAFRLYDCFKLDDSGNCIIRKTWLHCI